MQPARVEAPLQVPPEHGRTLELVREPSPGLEPRYRVSVVHQDGDDRRCEGGFVLMRLAEQIPYDWIADNTRWMRKPQTYGSTAEALAATARVYRRSLWDDQDAYVEFWCEKDAVAGVLYEVTDLYTVPLMVGRGFSSLTFLASAAEAIKDQRRSAYLYHFGDFDPSGVEIARNVEKRLRQLAPNADITFQRMAVTPEQIEKWNLPTRPNKTTDSRTRNFTGKASVELDAISADELRRGGAGPHRADRARGAGRLAGPRRSVGYP